MSQSRAMKVLNVAEKNDASKRIAALLSGGNSRMVRRIRIATTEF